MILSPRGMPESHEYPLSRNDDLAVELKNFRATAERMNMTPAAISNRIAVMEQELGIRLFERDVREVRLTHEGMLFVEGARDIVARYGLLTAVRPAATVEDTVRIGLVPSMAFTLLAGIMELLRSKFPHIRVALTTDTSGPLAERLERRELDLVLGLPGPSASYTACWTCVRSACSGSRMAPWRSVNRRWAGRSAEPSHHFLRDRDVQPWPPGGIPVRKRVRAFAGPLLQFPGHHGLHDHGGDRHRGVAPSSSRTNCATALRVLRQAGLSAHQLLRLYLESPSSRLAPLIASIAYEVATQFCSLMTTRWSVSRKAPWISGRWPEDLRGGFAPARGASAIMRFPRASVQQQAGGERTHIRFRRIQRRGRAPIPTATDRHPGAAHHPAAAGRDRAAGHRQPVRPHAGGDHQRGLRQRPGGARPGAGKQPGVHARGQSAGGHAALRSGHAGIPRRPAQVLPHRGNQSAVARRRAGAHGAGQDLAGHARDAASARMAAFERPAHLLRQCVPQRSRACGGRGARPATRACTGRCW